MEDNDFSSDDQFVEDFDYYLNDDDFCLLDIEEKKITKLTKKMNVIKEILDKFDDNKLKTIGDIKKDFYLLCDNNRYLIDDSYFLQKLESNINENISCYENKLFKIYEDLVDKEDLEKYTNLMNKEDKNLLSINHENDYIINYHESNNLVIHPDIENYIKSNNKEVNK